MMCKATMPDVAEQSQKQVDGSWDRLVKYWVPLLSLIIAICVAINSMLQTRNASAIRFDAFNLDMLKLQINAGATFVTTVDNQLGLALNSLTNIEVMNRFIEQDLPKAYALPDPDGKVAQAVQQKFNEQMAQIKDVNNNFSASLQGLQMQVNTFTFTVPVPAGRALTATLPQLDPAHNMSAQWGAPVALAMAAYAKRDATVLNQTLAQLATINSEVAAGKKRIEAEAEKWERGKVMFLCA